MCSEVLRLFYGFNDVLVQPFVPDRAVVAFDIGVLLGLTGLDMLQADVLFPGPAFQLFADVFQAVIDPDGTGFAPPFDDAVETSGILSAGSEKSTSMPRHSRLKSSRTFNNRNDLPSPNRSAMKSIDHTRFRLAGTAKTSGLSRFNRLLGLILRCSSCSR